MGAVGLSHRVRVALIGVGELTGRRHFVTTSSVAVRSHGPVISLSPPVQVPHSPLPWPARFVSGAQKARDLNKRGYDQQMSEYDAALAEEREKETKAPWHRVDADEKPVERSRTRRSMVKGKLLTTPSRLLKLVLPLRILDPKSHRTEITPLALLVHPQQPLSYLERLIQSELPSITTEKGEGRTPSITFRAKEAKEDELRPKKLPKELAKKHKASGEPLSEGSVDSYSGDGREGDGTDEGEFVKWSASTEIGDFIRDAARAKEFEVEIEGTPEAIKIAVPSFNDRTFYLRQRLRRTARMISNMATVKQECDRAAHDIGQRLAISGCGVLVVYWFAVWRLTFYGYGWEIVEPITYLVGLSGLIGGYMWFLYHNREVSYRNALNITISARQKKLYEARGFDLHKWEALIEEGNALRKEIKAVAAEYDVEYDEKLDEQDEAVTKALRDERKNGKSKSKKSKDDDDEDEDDDDDDD